MINILPGAIPLTRPIVLTTATLGLALLQLPPGAASASVKEPPTQADVIDPVIGAIGLMVTDFVV